MVLPRRGRVLLFTVVLAAVVLPAGKAFAPQSTSDAAIYPLAVCRDGIRFLFWADFYTPGTDPGDEDPFRSQPVQAAAPVPAPDANGRLSPPADTLVLDVTLQVPYAPQDLAPDFSAPPVFPKYPPKTHLSRFYPQPTETLHASYTGDYTLRWSRKLKAGHDAVVLSFDRFSTTSNSAEVIADVDNCRLFK